MNAKEIFEKASKSKLLNDPYVEKVWNLIGDRSLFQKSPDYLRSLRKSLFRDALKFFSANSEYYANLFERLSMN
ncbi:MAG: hypothetical protein QXZ59_03570, partial [Nitrososphaeria archaeon]